MQLNEASVATDTKIAANAAYAPGASLLERVGKEWAYLSFKRSFDIVGSALAIAVLSPLFLAVAAAIKAEDGGPVIYTRICVGKHGKTYRMYKFRSMKVSADNLEKWLTPEQIEEYRKEIKLKNDPRITKVGSLIRKTSIDELAQLFSILQGSMSFVGPRPLVREELEYFGDDIDAILSVKPGLTGYWQVNGRSDCTYESGERQKMELHYVMHRSLWMDLKILLRTVKTVCCGKGAY